MAEMRTYKSVTLDYFDTNSLSWPVEIELDCTPDQLFDSFEDPVSWTIWAGAIKHVEWTSPKPFGPGTTRTVTMVGGGVGEEVFFVWERGKRMAFHFTRGNLPIETFAEDYLVTDLGNGRCKLRWTVSLTPTGIQKYTMPLFSPMMGFFLGRMMKSLQRYIAKQNLTAPVAAAAE